MRYVNTFNGHSEMVRFPACFLWSLLFGPLFFIFKGIWHHALLAFLLAFVTLGASHFIYAFFASSILKADYLKRGWVPCPHRMGYSARQGTRPAHRLQARGYSVPRDAYGRISRAG